MSKKKFIDWLLDHGVVITLLFIVMVPLAVISTILVLGFSFVVWWIKIH